MASSPSSNQVLTAAGTLIGSAILFKTIANDLVPEKINTYFSSSLKKITRRLIEEFGTLNSNQMFEAANIYLGSIVSPSTHRIKVNKTPKDDELAVTVDKNEEIIDFHGGIKFYWVLQSSAIKQVSKTGTQKTELKFFELSFHKKHKDYALKVYLPFILKRSREIKEEIKTVRLLTVNYDGTDYWSSVVLNHPATFVTMAMDPRVKLEVIDEAQSMNNASSTNQVIVIDEAAQGNVNPANDSNEVEGETIVYQGRSSVEGSSLSPIYNNGGAMHISSSYVQQENYVYPLPAMGLFFVPYPRAPVETYRRKLLILDINGLLADIVKPAPKDRKGDVHMTGRAIFKRPFCDDFLRFCFQNFDVGIWSSRSKKLIDRIVDYLLGNLRNKLFFCWDMTHATRSVFKTLENRRKPLVCKEIRKFWGDDNHRYYCKKGDYDATNTLLIDDSPYKALLNPLHTAIFPSSFSYLDQNDNSLGPGGDLRVYLEGVLLSDNVQKYVEQHPFGQSAISETHPSWEFYSRVLRSMTQT